MTAPNQVSQYASAARRHFADSSHLYADKRLASADQLAGFAAECALKVILLQFLGAHMHKSGKPASMINKKEVLHGHLPDLWINLPLVASGRNAANFATLVAQSNPFKQWSVFDRYSDGKTITDAQVNQHLSEARKILAMLQQAQFTGALT